MTLQLKRLAIAGAFLTLAAGAAEAGILHYVAPLKPVAKEAGGDHAKGRINATLDIESRTLDYTVTYSGLSGPVTSADFRQADAPPADPFLVAPAAGVSQSIHATVRLTDQQIGDLNAGKWFFSVRTGANPDGELGGKLTRTSGF